MGLRNLNAQDKQALREMTQLERELQAQRVAGEDVRDDLEDVQSARRTFIAAVTEAEDQQRPTSGYDIRWRGWHKYAVTHFRPAPTEREKRNADLIVGGIFFATDVLPMLVSPGAVRGPVEPVVEVNRVQVPVRVVHESAQPGPYLEFPDPPSVDYGKDYTRAQKRKILEANRTRNQGALVDDVDGTVLQPPTQSRKGITPPGNEAQVDHGTPVSVGGSSSYKNARVRSRANNIKKGPKVDVPK
jgi:hypothetical protein